MTTIIHATVQEHYNTAHTDAHCPQHIRDLLQTLLDAKAGDGVLALEHWPVVVPNGANRWCLTGANQSPHLTGEDDPRFTLNVKVRDLLERRGSSDDHTAFRRALVAGGLCEPVLSAVHQAVIGAMISAAPPPAPAPEGWINWTGGPCPVPDGTPVEVRMHNGVASVATRAELLSWGHYAPHHPWDIMEYRLVRMFSAAPPVATRLDEVKRHIQQDTTDQPASARQVGGRHYKDVGLQPWDVIDTWPHEQRVGAYRAGLLKYTMRMGTKDDSEVEIRKAGHYAQKLAEVLAEKLPKGT